MIVIIDYGMGNLQSVANAFELLGESVLISKDPKDIQNAKALVLPGVGAFSDGMKNLNGLRDILEEEIIIKKKPFLGICLGMQLLARKSYEHGEHEGLGWIEGEVRRMEPRVSECKIPHMGWNDVTILQSNLLFSGLTSLPTFYFVHSYSLVLDEGFKDCATSECEHALTFTASVRKGNIFGVQFHPEKSQYAGLKLLQNFIEYTKCNNGDVTLETDLRGAGDGS